MRIESYGYTMPVHPMMDFCRLQRLINNWGGNDVFPAFPSEPQWPGDRLSQYGFDIGRPAPDQPGVYAVIACVVGFNGSDFYRLGSEHILYIGCGKSICRRLSSPDHKFWKIQDRLHIVATRHLVTEDYINVERSLIRTLRPWFNIQHNG